MTADFEEDENMTTFKVWNRGQHETLTIGDSATVFKCGGGLTVFGEPAKLARATKQHLVFVTESGADVKTPIDNISTTIGEAKAEGYCVSLKSFESFEHMIRSKVCL